MAEHYLIEGVGFLPQQVHALAAQFPLRVVFIGCASMTPQRFDQYPGHSVGYSFLPEEKRRRFAQDIPAWSAFIQQQAEVASYPYVDMSEDFESRLSEAEYLLTADQPA
jgi:hypothetical protein